MTKQEQKERKKYIKDNPKYPIRIDSILDDEISK
jgi:hypothetical protein